ncbi:electron transfer flavoprotein-ubiquinone oxidoreductase [Chitinibacter fontanus]|uniref:Electron transfer flavoprotein-ubiquinone oxidoreductase n=1 Tax=Chitinibacter fontanus TaxID=1737446 RepID=A0A7D5V8G5_9NEIS|nr:electron transfer flavoprotein-ubiquinone oxidoreductase [Chitinibacter fontanus]QLI80240.1 electron transfer flavoprotein-ubiquinone oxidoreductase [Chitinibacter fontanus]
MSDRDQMQYDVVIVGAGPAGLSAAIRLKQHNSELSVCVLEKGAQVGAHIMSGAVIDPIGLNQLIPDWQSKKPQLATPVSADDFLVLDEDSSYRMPHALLPPPLRNDGCFIVRLGEVCAFLAEEAENLGVEIYPGFAASEVLYNAQGAVCGIASGDMGIAKDGSYKADYTRGIEILAKYTLIGEGARGSLTGELEAHFGLRKQSDPQHYGLGVKEVWQVAPEQHQLGKVQHALGWPLGSEAQGGAFIYHLPNHLVAVGYVVHLNYSNPTLSPFDELQRFKTHPSIRPLFKGGKRIAYGARAIAEGGWQSLPQLSFPGGVLMGCAAGLLNFPRIKGVHNAMLSGIAAAQAVSAAIAAGREQDELSDYQANLNTSGVLPELHSVRNIKPALAKLGTLAGTMYAGTELWLAQFGVKLPWTLRSTQPDHTYSKQDCSPIKYPKPDGVLTFSKLDSLTLANVSHEHDQPVHLQLRNPELITPVHLSTEIKAECYYCPAGVYEIVELAGQKQYQINAQNCLHCKTCDIKDRQQNIHWVTPEGGGGPMYTGM